MSVCACASLWYAKYLWHVYQRVQNVKMVCVCVFVCVPNIKLVKCKNGICLCVPVSVYVHVSVCGMPLINLVSLACLPMSQKVQNVNFLKNP